MVWYGVVSYIKTERGDGTGNANVNVNISTRLGWRLVNDGGGVWNVQGPKTQKQADRQTGR